MLLPNEFSPFHVVLSTIAVSTPDDLDSERVRQGECWEITRILFQDETTAVTSVTLSLEGPGPSVPISYEEAVVAGDWYWDDGPFYVFPGQYLRVRFTGATVDDILKAAIHGRVRFWDGGG